MSPAVLWWLIVCVLFFIIFIFYLNIFTLTLAVRQTCLLFILSCISECIYITVSYQLILEKDNTRRSVYNNM